MRHQKAIEEFLALCHEPWMSESDKAEFNRELLAVTRKTMEQLDEDIEEGVRNGHSVEEQLAILRALLE